MDEMSKEDLEKLHKALLLIADEIDRICKKNDISYSLIAGSMLGAIRHRGFIPWDDDFDIGFLRAEYERFLDACEYDLDSRFELQTNTNDPYYVYGFSKILLKGTSLVQFGHEKTKYKKGIFVDLFPFDYIPDNLSKRKNQKRTNYFLIKILRQKMRVSDNNSWGLKEKILFRAIDFGSIFISKNMLVQKLNANMKKYNFSRTSTVSNMSGYYGYEKESIPAEYFENVIEVQFEDRQYAVIAQYDKFLSSYYGDYMQLPPIDKRRTHAFQNLDFGIYQNIL